MTDIPKHKKPKTVLHAEYALWIWTAWMFLFGIYQSLISIQDIEQEITTQLQGAISISSGTLMEITVASYALLALTSVWIIFKIGAGKNWARTSLLLGFILDAAWTAMPPYHGLLEFVTYIPDLGLQVYAVFLLYTPPGNRWFNPAAHTKS